MSYVLKSSNKMPKFGIGTWRMGENESKSSIEINAVYCALKNNRYCRDVWRWWS